jgi:NAD(P)-dependent dehydrogenase (short-subunit alcohol dehydrogenase family)
MLAVDLSGQVVLVTGVSGGIGSAMAEIFATAGATVVGVDLKKTAESKFLRHFFELDITDGKAVQRCVQQILEEEERVDCLINNAGIARDAPIWKMTEADWDLVLNVNLKGAFHFIHCLAPHFREKKRGKIVNISSINGLRGKFGLANYSASKAGLIALTKTVAKELGRSLVNVNAIAPGYVLTPLVQGLSEKNNPTSLGRNRPRKN